MIEVPDVSDIEVAFGCEIMRILPKWADIPEEFKKDWHPWRKVVSDWFFFGLKKAKWETKEGVDNKKAIRALMSCLGSFEPSHEHKEAGVAFLLSQWFHSVSYEPTGRIP